VKETCNSKEFQLVSGNNVLVRVAIEAKKKKVISFKLNLVTNMARGK
jgi:hypothetical protein